MRSLRLALIASARYPIVQPFAGGMEAHTWSLASELRNRGHSVEVFAGAGSDPALGVTELGDPPLRMSAAAVTDSSMLPRRWVEEHHAYLALMMRLAEPLHGFDVVHNNSLHYLPIAMAQTLSTPLVTTLHTPPTPWMESAIQASGNCSVTFAAVSAFTAAAWRHLVPNSRIVHNGVNIDRWIPGPGGGPVVWAGRLVPEKGVPLAIRAARESGHPLRVAGPIVDPDYFDAEVRPLLTDDIDYVGHLDNTDLATLFGEASATLVTPCWDEPYGLVVAESLACGTPVCGFARGALPELVTEDCARLVDSGDVSALARAIGETTILSRTKAREHAVSTCSHIAMVDGYEQMYTELAA
ncbi:MAG: glycosyltransferase family 4 protein [Actinomycetota bacterium]|nr:glycosyltransferase family 4 protein [Actinomycetota bacterium]